MSASDAGSAEAVERELEAGVKQNSLTSLTAGSKRGNCHGREHKQGEVEDDFGNI